MDSEVEVKPLPKLPTVNVEKTLERYLDAIKAPLDDAAFKQTKALVQKFLGDKPLVDEVETLITKRSEEKENWSFEWWLDDMYMNVDLPLPINSNPGLVLPKQTFESDEDRLVYMAKLTKGLLDFKETIEKDAIKPDFVASKKDGTKQGLCMNQYKRIFSCYRRSNLAKDSQLDLDGTQSKDKELIAVLVRSQIYLMPVKKDGIWLDTEEIFQGLWTITQGAQTAPDIEMHERVPVLTSQNRRKWGEARAHLVEDGGNKAVLEELETCLFLVCLDEDTQNPTDPERSFHSRFRQMLSGNGPFLNGTNRWFDKTMQLIASPDGNVGMCYEHSVAEGVAVVNVIEDVVLGIQADGNTFPAPQKSLTFEELGITQVMWNVDLITSNSIVEAIRDFKRLDDNADLEIFTFDGFGKDQIKSFRCSPDAFCQMVLQLTYFKIYGKLCFSYESASTRRFLHGRVDNIRSSHPEALEWAKAMLDETAEPMARLDLFKRAMNKQTKIMSENITGEGLDIPMLGIREACKILRPAQELPLFVDESYSRSVLFQLSTSQVTTTKLDDTFMGYGAVVPDGYGVSYNLLEDKIIFCISSFYMAMDTDSRLFARHLTQSLLDLKQMFQK
ncbi:hypothetical protein TCAL_08825 [Tigriopus californicus]|uniref:Choline O-acetyltransferase n=1 Tax=Tigriopus californicus TaxID=6832 RepID=A0A553PRZ2_TIGCA|nr:choline O-acetyltransferase-like isoform X1 [Tigriopus californicus]TRY80456.1 hypothetical protein TCAL_08825 [Tigriopus californicus]